MDDSPELVALFFGSWAHHFVDIIFFMECSLFSGYVRTGRYSNCKQPKNYVEGVGGRKVI